eukprot:1188580-Prorocentrum_minimum.AAC.3
MRSLNPPPAPPQVRADTPFSRIIKVLAERLKLEAAEVVLTVDASFAGGGEVVRDDETPAELGLHDGACIHIQAPQGPRAQPGAPRAQAVSMLRTRC